MGLRPSGNQAEYALQQTAELSSYEYPDVKQVVDHDIYVDDCLSGEESVSLAHQLADRFELVVNRTGFQNKGCFNISSIRLSQPRATITTTSISKNTHTHTLVCWVAVRSRRRRDVNEMRS